jgi:acetyl esterase/lipase
MKLYKLFLAFAITLALFSCKKNETTTGGGTVTVAAKTILNVPYGADTSQRMDIYLPEGRKVDSTKVMVVIHGGSWVTGDKSDMNFVIDSLKRRLPDYAFFNINYRLSTGGTTNVFPTQEQDVKAAVNYAYSKASDYLVSQKIVLLGVSAGGHLAMLQGFKDTVPVRVKAVVSFYGPSNLPDMYANPVGGNPSLRIGLAYAIGATPAINPAIYFSSSPVNYIRSTSPPTILFHGGADAVVAVSQSTQVRDLLTTAGVTNQYNFYINGIHGLWSAADNSDAMIKLTAFLTANVR